MGWLSSNENLGKATPLPAWVEEYITVTPEAKRAWAELHSFTTAQTVFVSLACATSFFFGWRLAKTGSSWRRITSISDISSSKIGADAPLLRGRVVSVSDGDTFRLLHVPTPFHSSRLSQGEKLSETTLPIRVCTIDTPETAKFGKSGQPFGQEAKKLLESLTLDRIVKVRLLQKDQYGRGVAEVLRRGFFFGFPTKYADQEMLRAGLAEVYQGGGAVYGHKGKETYLAMEEKAKKKKKGMWSQKNRESAAEYKARMKEQG